MDETKAVKITDIENMILLADGVLFASKMLYMYDDDGDPVFDKDASKERYEKDKAEGIEKLIVAMICDEDYDISDAVDITAKEIIEKIAPIRERILGLFRGGKVSTDSHTFDKLYADPSVPDEWLLELYAMRVRDQMIANGLHRPIHPD